MNLAAEFDRAFRLHQQGKLREAFMRYDAVIKADPRHAAALHYSGVVLLQAGKHADAIARIRASIGIEPGSSDAWSNLALALQAVDRGEAAVNALEEAARLAPTSVAILTNLVGGAARAAAVCRSRGRRRGRRSRSSRRTRPPGTTSRWR